MKSIDVLNIKYMHTFVEYEYNIEYNIHNVFKCEKCNIKIYTGNYDPYWISSKDRSKYKNCIDINNFNLSCNEVIIKRLLE